MDSCKFRKIVCALGHSSDVIPLDAPLPKKCPVCGQPYDRRYNVPIMCLEDGTISEEPERKDFIGKREEIPVNRRKRGLLNDDLITEASAIHTRRREEVSQKPETGRNTVQKNIVLYSDGKKITVPIEKGYLGRGELGADIFLMNQLISRRHAQIYSERFGNVYIKDEDSLNGTFIDDGGGRRRLLPGETVVLKSGDKLWLADQLLVIEEE